jgi:lysozyme
MITTKILFTKLMEFEGLKLKAYVDVTGVPTIGYGHTYNVRMGDRITAWYAKDLLSEDIAYFEEKVKELNVAHTEGQLDALVSFAFNLGVDRLAKSTLLKVIRQGGSKSEIKREFKRWVYADGKKLKGLEKRREWEAKRFFE